MSGGEAGPRPLPADDFELYARKWTAEDGILRDARRIEEDLGLHPDLVDAIEKAIRDDDRGAWWAAMADFFAAAREAKDL